MNFSIIIGNSRVDETRQRNLEYIIKFYQKYFPYSQIIVTDQIEKHEATVPPNVLYLPITTNKPYSRSLSFNLAIPHCTNDWIIYADNDCLMSVQTIRELEMDVLNRIDMYIPYRHVLDLSEGQTTSMINGGKVNGATPRTWNGKAIINHGGITIISKKGFEIVGGFDPQFWGWGGEDYAFFGKCEKLLRWKRSHIDMYHLDHKRTHKRAHNPEADWNRKEAHRIFNMNVPQLKKYIADLGTNHYTHPQRII